MSQVPITNPLGNADTSGIAQNQQFGAVQQQQRFMQTQEHDQQTRLAQMEIEDRKAAQVAQIKAQEKLVKAQADAEHASLQAKLLSDEKQTQETLQSQQTIAGGNQQVQREQMTAEQQEAQRQRDFQKKMVDDTNKRADMLEARKKEAVAKKIEAVQEMLSKGGPEQDALNGQILQHSTLVKDLQQEQMGLTAQAQAGEEAVGQGLKAFDTRVGGLVEMAKTKGASAYAAGAQGLQTGLAMTLLPDFEAETPELTYVIDHQSRSGLQKGIPLFTANAWNPNAPEIRQLDDPMFVGSVVKASSGKYVKKLGEGIEQTLMQATGAGNLAGNVSGLLTMMWDASQATDPESKKLLLTKAEMKAKEIAEGSGDKVSMYDLERAVNGAVQTLQAGGNEAHLYEQLKSAQSGPTGMVDWITDYSGNKRKQAQLKMAVRQLGEISGPLSTISSVVFSPDKVDTPEEMQEAKDRVMMTMASKDPTATDDVRRNASSNFIVSRLLRKASAELSYWEKVRGDVEEKKTRMTTLRSQIKELETAQGQLQTKMDQWVRGRMIAIDPYAGMSVDAYNNPLLGAKR